MVGIVYLRSTFPVGGACAWKTQDRKRIGSAPNSSINSKSAHTFTTYPGVYNLPNTAGLPWFSRHVCVVTREARGVELIGYSGCSGARYFLYHTCLLYTNSGCG